ncbi:hypothetical protein CQW23_30849 [Capsicum baccatum]|uniref:FF domain-containing protein n=1 Tax=Capsicum baccatum TaxID=33114 RepID=A0A2G2V9H0_CAPBA|nr:hypothetical protein CQW23_30849 [Capsicum baccatum]
MLKQKGRHTDHKLANLLQDKGINPNFAVMLKENRLDPMILALLRRSSLDAEKEHRDNNPPVIDSNDVEDVLANHISFSEELRLQGLGKWLQRCRVDLIEIRVKALEGVHSDYGDTHEDPKYYYNKVTRTSKWRMPDEVKVFSPMIETVKMKNSSKPASPAVANSEKIGIATTLGNYFMPPVSEATTTQDALVYGDGFPLENREKDAAITEIRGATPSDGKTVELGQLVYEIKTEAKSAFKTLLESANIGSDCTWDQAIRAVINDQRYGALKFLCEQKQSFNEVISIFEHDERFKAVERAKDREELFKIMWRNLRKRPVASGRKFRTA